MCDESSVIFSDVTADILQISRFDWSNKVLDILNTNYDHSHIIVTTSQNYIVDFFLVFE